MEANQIWLLFLACVFGVFGLAVLISAHKEIFKKK